MTAKTTRTDYNHHRGAAPLLRAGDYRQAGVYVALALVGFGAACAFWQYLITGRWVDLSLTAFQENLRTPLGDILIRPLSIFSHPWMIPVSGLLLGVIIFVPIIVSILYRLLIAAVFVAMVVLLGHGVVLGMAILLGCLLSARTPLRSDMPFLAALLGLLPVGLYLYLFGLAGVDSSVSQPLQKWIIRVPFLIAIVAAVPAFAVVLTLTKLTHYRSGVVWPVLAFLLAVPVATFYLRVGGDELDYCLIAEHLAAGDAMLESRPMDIWRKTYADGLNEQALPAQVEKFLHDERRDLQRRCDRFLQNHPRSERAASVLWIKAQCVSLQYDEPALQMGVMKFTADYPLGASESVWLELSQQHKQTPQGALADWRLGELLLRRAFASDLKAEQSADLIRQADQRLTAAELFLAALPEVASGRHEAGMSSSVFYDARSVPAASYYAGALQAVRRLRWRISENNVLDDPAAAEALAALLGANPHRLDYLAQLRSLLNDAARKRERTKMGDNLILEVAKATPDRLERAVMLRSLAGGLNDAAIEANYELAILLRREPSLQSEAFKKPEEYFRIVRDSRENPWRQQAQEMLDRLAAGGTKR